MPQRARRRIARVGKALVTARGLALVQPLEIRVRHIDLAADLQDFRCVFKAVRDIRNGAGIGGDIFAGGAVATRGGLDQLPVFIAQRE